MHLADNGALDFDYIERAHQGLRRSARARARDRAGSSIATAAATRPCVGRRRRVSSSCSATTKRVVTCFSQGVNQSAQGTDKVNTIINCHLATGRIGKPGMGPFSLTGQPNAMGGREVGGLANQLAAHMDFTPDDIDRVGRFWRAPNMAQREGLKAVQMFEAIERGEIKALWVMATNPAVSLPRAGAVREGAEQARTLRRLRKRASQRHSQCRRAYSAAGRGLGREGRHGHEFRTAHFAPARVPAAAGRGEAGLVDRVAEVGAAHGLRRGFRLPHAADVFREHAALSAFENDGTRDFDIGALARDRRQRVQRARAGAMARADERRPRAAFLRRRRVLHA